MEIEITKGFLMFWGGIGGAVLTLVISIVYFNLTARKAKKLLKRIDEEDF
ncbi:MAG: hypothetical protein NC228_06600 [[Eubacterium] siraeum]|nr:hypothetical protein [[Eubacterium] siraeum]